MFVCVLNSGVNQILSVLNILLRCGYCSSIFRYWHSRHSAVGNLSASTDGEIVFEIQTCVCLNATKFVGRCGWFSISHCATLWSLSELHQNFHQQFWLGAFHLTEPNERIRFGIFGLPIIISIQKQRAILISLHSNCLCCCYCCLCIAS